LCMHFFASFRFLNRKFIMLPRFFALFGKLKLNVHKVSEKK
jgi:hypothetical protein